MLDSIIGRAVQPLRFPTISVSAIDNSDRYFGPLDRMVAIHASNPISGLGGFRPFVTQSLPGHHSA